MEQYQIALLALWSAACFWAGYWARGTEAAQAPDEPTEHGRHPL
jgi:hypothetical protein